MVAVRGIRGAITIEEDKSNLVIEATKVLLEEILKRNPTLSIPDIACAFFTVTDDVNSEFPAKAAREIGWNLVPLLCAKEIPVPTSVSKCIRVLVLWNTDLPQEKIQPVYLRGAKVLRQDIKEPEEVSISDNKCGG